MFFFQDQSQFHCLQISHLTTPAFWQKLTRLGYGSFPASHANTAGQSRSEAGALCRLHVSRMPLRSAACALIRSSWCQWPERNRQDCQESSSVQTLLKLPNRQSCWWLRTLFTVASSSTLSFISWGELSVGAYTLTRWTGPMVVCRQRARILSEPPMGGTVVPSSVVLTANPTTYYLVSTGFLLSEKGVVSIHQAVMNGVVFQRGSRCQFFASGAHFLWLCFCEHH